MRQGTWPANAGGYAGHGAAPLEWASWSTSKILNHARLPDSSTAGTPDGRSDSSGGGGDGDWLVKFPGTTRNLQGSVPSYTTAPVSEWLGSHVYAALGIPVHETVLGIRDGRIVCACRDFTFPDSRLVNFHDLKNSLSDDEPGFTKDASTGSGVVFADVRSAIHRIPVLRSIDGVSDRFWDMFVVDAFIPT